MAADFQYCCLECNFVFIGKRGPVQCIRCRSLQVRSHGIVTEGDSRLSDKDRTVPSQDKVGR